MKNLIIFLSILTFFQFTDCRSETIAMIGDSITAGTVEIGGIKYCTAASPHYVSRSCNGRGLKGLGGWTPYIQIASKIPVFNYGVSGNRTSQMTDRSQIIIRDHDTIMILGGTNDVIGNVPTSETLFNLKSMVDSAISQNKKVIVSTIPPLHSRYPELESKVIELNSEIKRMKGVIVVDIHKALSDNWPYPNSSDGIHLNDYSYRSTTEVWVRSLTGQPNTTPNLSVIMLLLLND